MSDLTSLIDILTPAVDSSNDLNDPTITNSEPAVLSLSPYLDLASLISTLKNNSKCLSILSLNCQSLNAHIYELKILVRALADEGLKINVLCFQETWLSQDPDLSQLEINGYKKPILEPKKLSDHGGLCIYVDSDLQHEPFSSIPSTTWENQFIKIITPDCNKNVILGNVYRNPNIEGQTAGNSIKTFINEFKLGLDNLAKRNSTTIIAGDYNLDLLKINNDPNITNYFDSLMSVGFIPSITLPTRFSIQHGTSSLIDNIFLHAQDMSTRFSSGVYTTKISDHFGCILSLELNQKCSGKVVPPKFITIKSEKPENDAEFISLLKSSNIMNRLHESEDSDMNESYLTFEKIFEEARKKAYPTKIVRFNRHKHKINDWMTPGLLRSLSFRDDLYQKFREAKRANPNSNETKDLKRNLDTYNDIFKKSIQSARKLYYSKLFEKHKLNMKQTWNTINEILRRKKPCSSFPEQFLINDTAVSDRKTIADAFNDFFANVGKNLASSIGNPSTDVTFESYLNDKTDHVFEFTPIDANTTLKAIDSIKGKSSCGVDNISPNLMKLAKNELAAPLTFLINKSFKTKTFPDNLKIAKITPVYKKGDPKLVDNYRPISLLPAFSKVFERIIHNQLSDYFTTNKLLSKAQYGFRSGHSTEMASLELTDRILDIMNSDKIPFCIFMDLSKAFDTIDYDILLSKLNHYGLSESALSLFRSYLQNRKQFVTIEGIDSERNDITTGVPQGSILGPLLFIIYINDLCSASTILDILSYADDTTLLGSLETFDAMNPSESINVEVAKVSDWLIANKLSLNVTKTKYMLFHKKNKKIPTNIELKIQNKILEQVDTFNFLGLDFDKEMCWKSQLNKISVKIMKTIGILAKLKNFLPQNILLTLYNSLILPHINYGILCWGFVNTNRILKLQKKALRLITRAKINAHADPIFANLKLLKIDDLFLRLLFKFSYLHHHQRLAVYLNNFQLPRKNTGPETRFGKNIRLPTHDKNYTRMCVRYGMIQLLNSTSRPTKPNKLNTNTFVLDVGNDKLQKIINSMPIELLNDILIKFDTHSQQGFTNYIKIRLLRLYNIICTKANCNTCHRQQQPNTAPVHRKVENMVTTAIMSLNEQNGSSCKSICQYIASNNTVNIDQLNSQIKLCLVRGISNNKFKQISGNGISGKFKLVDNIRDNHQKTVQPKKKKPVDM